MDEQRIQQYLIELAEEEVQDVNLLNDIQAELKKPDRVIIRRQFWVARVAAAVAIFFMVSVAGYALLTQNELVPETIPQDLITEINSESTIDELTVNVDWAYADAHHIAVQFSTIHDSTVTSRGQLLNVELTTVDGTVIPQNFGGGGGGGGNNSAIIETSSMLQFDARSLSFSEDMLDLILTITYGTPSASNQGGTGGSGGGGGGGGSNAPAPSEPVPERTYTFEFSIPLYPARDGNITQETISVDNNAVSIQNVRITPSMVIFDLCSTLLAEGWMPRIYVQSNQPLPDYIQQIPFTTLDGEVAYPASGMPNPVEIVDGESCQNIAVSVPFTADSGSLVIVVDHFYQFTEGTSDELIDADIAYFEALGFDLSYEIIEPPMIQPDDNQAVLPRSADELVIYTIEAYPETLTVSEARAYVSINALQNRVDGDWVFEVTVE